MWKREYEHASIGSGNDFLTRYLQDYGSFKPFFNGDYRRFIDLNAHAFRLVNRTWKTRFNRDLLANTLSEYLDRFPVHRAVHSNIQKLRKPNCVTVVTGQQAGLGGGPMYVLYKAITAIYMAQVTEICSGKPCVPVFWNASDDSDLEEVNRFRSISPEGNIQKFRFKMPAGKTHVRSVEMPPIEDPQWQKLISILPEGPYRARAAVLLADSAGRDFGEAFTRLLLELFGSQGLIVIEPWALTEMPAWKRIHQAELNHHEKHRGILQRAAEALQEDGLNSGVVIRNQLNMFLTTEDEKRHSITYEGRKYLVDDEDKPVSKTALNNMMKEDASDFTPNVMLRPVLQNAIFPTVAYVGGPAEIAYHSLLKPLHRQLKVFFPLLTPRLSMTLIHPADTTGFDEAVKFRNKLQWRQSEAEIAFTDTEKQMDSAFSGLEAQLSALPSADADTEKLKHRLKRAVSDIMQPVRHRPTDVIEGGNEHKLLLNKYFPAGRPQEREISLLAAYAIHGPNLANIKWPYSGVFANNHIVQDEVLDPTLQPHL
ncbi:MAG: bacillithiol biosynthesis cysteine-adding enzyme BshC [Planctomycetes bacterium]|nr:bacillithiol biosynthesis cysteine-adding enzyme BshC [Planctomycetota bacterium]